MSFQHSRENSPVNNDDIVQPINQNQRQDPPPTSSTTENRQERPNPIPFNEFFANSRPNTTMPNSNDNQNEIHRIGMKPPAFSKRDPDLYFIQMESQFRNASITQDQTKYDYVVGSLDSATLINISDIIRAPPAENKYEAIKSRLIKDFTDSENRKLRRLLQECELGDQKPSQLLRQMKDLSNGALNDEALKSLWLNHLPEAVRAVVSIAEGNLERCTQQADKMMEMGNYGGNIATIQRPTTTPTTNEAQSLQSMIESLRKEVHELKLSQKSRGRSSTPHDNTNRNRNRSHGRSESQIKKYPTCYYHHRFGADAKKCAEPCDFKTKN